MRLAQGGSNYPIRLLLASQCVGTNLEAWACKLNALPHASQAYAIVGHQVQEHAAEWLLIANTPCGLLAAARTFYQLVSPPQGTAAQRVLCLPLGEITDWPDIPERGLWTEGYLLDEFSPEELELFARHKLNLIEARVKAYIDEAGQPRIQLHGATIAEAEKLGIKIVPILSHLEQLAHEGLKGWEDCYGVPADPEEAKGAYSPSLCMSKQRTRQLIFEWLKQIALLPRVQDVMVWLSENEAPCYCQDCLGKEPFALEVATIIGAFRDVQAAVNPNLRLRLLTTQGSYPVNDQILQAVPEDIGVTYYDGGRTYNPFHTPMIYPLMEQFARSGRWLGVYPTLIGCWRMAFPWTGPQFIQFRMAEFANKGLSNVAGYAPCYQFYLFNIAATAEWSWNHNGRSPREFARAYAYATGIQGEAAELYAQWAEKIGPIGWDLAGTTMFLRLSYDPSFGLDQGKLFGTRVDNRPEVLDAQQIERDLAEARDALILAHRLGLPDAVDETIFDIAGLLLLRSLYTLSRLYVSGEYQDQANLQTCRDHLDMLDKCAAVLSVRLPQWAQRISERTAKPITDKITMTAQIAAKSASIAREKIGQALNIPDPYPEYRYRQVGNWSADVLTSTEPVVLTFDVTAYIQQPGQYATCLNYLPGTYGMTPTKIQLLATQQGTTRRTFTSNNKLHTVRPATKFLENIITIDQVQADDKYFLEITAQPLSADQVKQGETCRGTVGIRRIWTDDTIAQELF